MARSAVRTWWKSHRQEVVVKFYDASSVIYNEVGRSIFEQYLGEALAKGSFRPAPPPRLVGTGLESIQMGLDFHRKGVSATKIVVALGNREKRLTP